ncbi:MAG: hypothetical protein ACRERV_13245 [Methylococcales bacterium]
MTDSLPRAFPHYPTWIDAAVEKARIFPEFVAAFCPLQKLCVL